MSKIKIIPATVADYPRLQAIWESAVQATHNFLSEEDFAYYRSRLTDYFAQVELYVYKDEQGELAGFIGVADGHVEMLFVDNAFRRQGVGRQLLSFAVTRLNARRLDVNEQNQQALGFYTHMGFKIMGRSPLDGEGKPYPLLHLQYDADKSINVMTKTFPCTDRLETI